MKTTEVKFNLFNATCIGIATREPYRVIIETEGTYIIGSMTLYPNKSDSTFYLYFSDSFDLSATDYCCRRLVLLRQPTEQVSDELALLKSVTLA